MPLFVDTITARMKLENKDSLILRSATRANMEQTKIYSAFDTFAS